MYTITDLLDLSKTIAADLFKDKIYPWEVLADISDFIIKLGNTLPEDEYEKRGENVWIARDAKVFPSAYIGSPCIIDHGAEVRHCAFIRSSAIVGKNAVVGEDYGGFTPEQLPPVTVVGSECAVPDGETVAPGQMVGNDVYPKIDKNEKEGSAL